VVVGSGAAGIGCARWLLDYFEDSQSNQFDSGDDASGGGGDDTSGVWKSCA
jgi:hypothetical protein